MGRGEEDRGCVAGRGASAKGGQAQGPSVSCVNIPLLSEGIEANPGLLNRNEKVDFQ